MTGSLHRAARAGVPASLALRCSACGTVTTDPLAFRCPAARPGDDVDHLLEPPEPPGEAWPTGEHPNPFVRYRRLLYPYRLAVATGMSDERFVELVEELDRRVAELDGVGFRVTIVRPAPLVPGVEVWVKDETANVTGSHKGRHLMGLAVHLRVLEEVGLAPRDRAPLAIASCGNAALAAAVVAGAAGWTLEVFVPPWAPASTMRRLAGLGARIEVCHRRVGESGDPCYLRFRERVQEGALPFAAQGPENGLTLEGGATLGYELADQLPSELDLLYVQVGGGALATSVMVGLERAVAAGRLARLPILVAVQAAAAAPLARAYWALERRMRQSNATAAEGLAAMSQRRSEAMWPWERAPVSAASGILDDETYDWRRLVGCLTATGGRPVVVEETTLDDANRRGRTVTGIDVDHTGTAGLAGLLADRAARRVPDGSTCAVIFSGRRR